MLCFTLMYDFLFLLLRFNVIPFIMSILFCFSNNLAGVEYLNLDMLIRTYSL